MQHISVRTVTCSGGADGAVGYEQKYALHDAALCASAAPHICALHVWRIGLHWTITLQLHPDRIRGSTTIRYKRRNVAIMMIMMITSSQ